MPRAAQKSKLLPWQQDDAARLRTLFDARTGDPKPSQEEFGRTHGLGTQSNVWQYLSGHRPLNIDALVKFSVGLKVSPATISPTLAKEIARQAKFAEVAPSAERTQHRVGERVTMYGMSISHEAAMVAQEWEKLAEPMKSAVRQLIELAIAAQKRHETVGKSRKEGGRSAVSSSREAQWKP